MTNKMKSRLLWVWSVQVKRRDLTVRDRRLRSGPCQVTVRPLSAAINSWCQLAKASLLADDPSSVLLPWCWSRQSCWCQPHFRKVSIPTVSPPPEIAGIGSWMQDEQWSLMFHRFSRCLQEVMVGFVGAFCFESPPGLKFLCNLMQHATPPPNPPPPRTSKLSF